MGCGCGKKDKSFKPIFSDNPVTSVEPEDWGPCFWHLLHTAAEKTGRSTNPIICRDQANIMKWLIENLPTILPCQQCQNHARNYLLANPIPKTWETATCEDLRVQIRTWLFYFHHAVRTRLGQPITIKTPEECRIEYEKEDINQDFINDQANYVTYAIRAGWVKMDAWKRWAKQFSHLKLALV